VRGRIRTVLTSSSELAREKMWARIHLIPALQAEEDRDQVRRYLADKAREKELLGSETRVYNSDRYGVDLGRRGDVQLTFDYRFVRPTFAITPEHETK
jgi:NADH dehydrogenase (ubiquinone) 1 alpha subcomplex subunit 13